MNVTLPNGVVIKDVPMTATKEAIKQMAIRNGLASEQDFADTAATKPPEMTQGKPTTRDTSELFKDALKKGVASPLALGETMAGVMGLEGAEKVMKGAKESAYQSLGVQDFAPTSFSQKLTAGVGEAASDPTNLLTLGGGAVAKGMMSLGGKALKSSVEGGLAGGGAVLGGELGSKLGGTTGEVLGSLTGAVAAGTAPNRLGNLFSTGSSITKAAMGVGTDTEQLAKLSNDAVAAASNAKIKSIFVDALKADPNLTKEVMQAEEFKKILKSGLPASAAFGSNPYIDSIINRLLETNPEFRGAYGKQYADAKAALEQRKKQLFGGSEAAVEGLAQLGTENRLGVVKKSVDKRINALDKQAELLTKKLGTSADNQELGNRITKLLEDKEDAARKSVTPLYDNALNYAKENNITMPPDSVQAIYSFVNDARNSDIFAKFPSLSREITSKLSPKTTGGSKEMVQGMEIDVPVNEVFEGITPDVIDSLKRRLNADLRGVKDPTQYNLLKELRNLFEQGLDAIPDTKFVDDYRAADAVYREKVGVPFSASAIEMMDRAKFAEQVVPKVTLNASSLDEFLRAAGDEGKPLASNAFRSDFLNKTVKNGVIDKTAADKWFKSKGYLKGADPELFDELKAATTAVNGLELQKMRLGNEFKNAKAKKIFELADKNPEQLFNQLRNPSEYAKFINTYGNNKDAMDGAKALALSNISKSGNPIQDLSDSALSPTYKKLFGKDYNRVIEVMQASERLKKSLNPEDARALSAVVEADPLKKSIGVSAPEAMSQIRNPILGPVRAAANIASKMFQRMADKNYDAEAAALFLNPELGKVLLLAEKVNAMPDGNAKAAAAKRLSGMVSNVSDMLFEGTSKQAVKSAVVGAGSMPEDIQPEQQPDMAPMPIQGQQP